MEADDCCAVVEASEETATVPATGLVGGLTAMDLVGGLTNSGVSSINGAKSSVAMRPPNRDQGAGSATRDGA